MIRSQPLLWLTLCGCSALAGAAALSRPTPPTQQPRPPTSVPVAAVGRLTKVAAVGRRALQQTKPEACAATVEQLLTLLACAAVQAQLLEMGWSWPAYQ